MIQGWEGQPELLLDSVFLAGEQEAVSLIRGVLYSPDMTDGNVQQGSESQTYLLTRHSHTLRTGQAKCRCRQGTLFAYFTDRK